MNERPVHHLKESINYRVYTLASSLAKGATRYFGARFGVSLPEMRILSALGIYGTAPARELVATTAMDKALVSRVLSGLQKRELVESEGKHPSQRLRGWRLTSAGRAFVARLQPEWSGREAKLQAGLSVREREILADQLERLFWASEELMAAEAAEDRGKAEPAPRRRRRLPAG